MSAHTPGPWDNVSDLPQDQRGNMMALVSTNGGRTCIDATGSGKDFTEDWANARLIAAAPMMAEALHMALNAMHADNPEGLPLQYRAAADYATAALRAAGVIE